MSIVVEDGTGVTGANALASPSFAAEYHADRGNLTVIGEYEVSSAVFDPSAGTVSVPSNGANVPVGSIVQFEGATEDGNNACGYVTAVSTDLLTVRWLDDMASETVDVTLTVFDQSGWWATRRELEASLVNATEMLGSRPWYGSPVSDVQGTSFPRRDMVVRAHNQYYARGYAIPSDEVPLAVKHATCHLALEDLNNPLAEVIDPGRQYKRKKVGPIDKTYAAPTRRRRFPLVDRMIRGLHPGRSMFVPLGAGG